MEIYYIPYLFKNPNDDFIIIIIHNVQKVLAYFFHFLGPRENLAYFHRKQVISELTQILKMQGKSKNLESDIILFIRHKEVSTDYDQISNTLPFIEPVFFIFLLLITVENAYNFERDRSRLEKRKSKTFFILSNEK